MAFGNMATAHDAAEKSNASRNQNESRKFELNKVHSGEGFIGRFVGGADEPLVMATHTLGKFPNSTDIFCCNPQNGDAFCPSCARRKLKVPGENVNDMLSASSLQLSFSFISTRMVLKGKLQDHTGQVKDTKIVVSRSADAPDMIIFQPPTVKGQRAQPPVQYPESQFPYFNPALRLEASEEGLVILGGGTTSFVKAKQSRQGLGQAIIACERKARSICRCGGTSKAIGGGPATVSAVGYACSCCKRPLTITSQPGTTMTCPHCASLMSPVETLQCSAGCSNPARCELTDGYVRISKTGEGTDTTWHCEFLGYQEPAPQHAAILQQIASGNRPIPKPAELYPIPSVKEVEQAMLQYGISLAPKPGQQAQAPGFGAAPMPFGAAPAPFGAAPAPAPAPFGAVPQGAPQPAWGAPAAAPAGPLPSWSAPAVAPAPATGGNQMPPWLAPPGAPVAAPAPAQVPIPFAVPAMAPAPAPAPVPAQGAPVPFAPTGPQVPAGFEKDPLE